MGEAKRRGSFEERKLQAEVAAIEQALQRSRAKAAAEQRQREWDAAHPEQAAARRARSLRLSTVLAIAAGISGIHHK